MEKKEKGASRVNRGKMFHLTNFITLIRGPLALLFLFESSYIRISAILLAVLSDVFDGFLARKFNQISTFGTILDPIMDKIFVYGAIVIFYQEGSLTLNCLIMMLTRDICLFFYSLYYVSTRGFSEPNFRSIVWGKVSTGLQFYILFRICFQIPTPEYLYFIFVLLCPLIIIEFFTSQKSITQDKI
jgi:CDP-diacylglycerol---glycerol-3-phosphate 3-phosphatidyltransferase